jgi:hypothetical protein
MTNDRDIALALVDILARTVSARATLAKVEDTLARGAATVTKSEELLTKNRCGGLYGEGFESEPPATGEMDL